MTEEEKTRDLVVRMIVRAMYMHGIKISDLEKNDEWVKIHE